MLGAIIGDICGSIYREVPVEHDGFALLRYDRYLNLTDVSILLAGVTRTHFKNISWIGSVIAFFISIDNKWLSKLNATEDFPSSTSYKNGAISSLCALGFLMDDELSMLKNVKNSAISMNLNDEEIKGAMALSLGVYMATRNASKLEIKERISQEFGYDLDRALFEIRKNSSKNTSIKESVAYSFIAFFESASFESAVENAILLRSDASVQGAIVGALAEAYYKRMPYVLIKHALGLLPKDMKNVLKFFYKKYSPLARKRNIRIENRLFRPYKNPLREFAWLLDIEGEIRESRILHSRFEGFKLCVDGCV